MLREIVPAAPGEEGQERAGRGSAGRRWFRSPTMELVVWEDGDGVRLYQLLYRGEGREGVVEWRRGAGLFHAGLDDGEGRGGRVKATPILTGATREPLPPPDLRRLRDRFVEESEGLEAPLRSHVLETLRAGPDDPSVV